MVERYLARLKLTQDEAALYNPRPGTDILWLEWEKPDVVVAEFVGSDLNPISALRKSAAEIRQEVRIDFRNRVVEDNLGSHPKSPRRALKIETYLEHPNVTSDTTPHELKKAAEAATEVHDVELTKEQFNMIQRPDSGEKLEPREIRHTRQQPMESIATRTPDGRLIMRQYPRTAAHEAGKEEQELYVMSFGVIDIG